jgi:iron complex outermembrane receptor protein
MGSFGLLKSSLNFNHGSINNSYRGVYSNTHSEGYRDNNQYDRQTFTLATNHYVDYKNELSIVASYIDLKAFIPSSVNESTFLNSPKEAAYTWGKSKGFEESKRGLLGITWNHNTQQRFKQIMSVFGSFRDSYEPRPFNILEEYTMAYGIRSRLLGKVQLFKNPLNVTAGGEFFKDHYRSKTFQNLYEDFPDETGSVKGISLSDFNEDRSYHNIFLETNYELCKNILLEFGLNYNKTIYKLKDNFVVSEANPDQSGSYQFRRILSPKIGFSFLANSDISLYSTVSHGFSPISLAETLLPNGQINTDLKPETGWNYEVGTRGAIYKNKLQFNLALYRLDIKNLVVSRRLANDQYIGINAGQTRHDGLEIGLNYSWIDKKQFELSTFVNGTFNHFKFKEFIDGDDDFSGNDLTGVPSILLNAGMNISTEYGFYGAVNFQQVGSQPMSDSNHLYSDSYALTNLKIGYKNQGLKKLKINFFIGVDNLFGESYASQILINARSFNGSPPRYYYPGIPLNYYSGIKINYVL